ncbi:MAG: copper chaperone PCu(A)C [Candidatus Thiodiazotropha lotti]|uniref:Copper chaperone PCu(A)C n=1 Tax=Candidatus Thiodiazotropha lotti TaxID=2792787 RepID=A0A9E4N0J5_9GAMM|nr:copper chaperone PCu(A)C [Candidatus Thiodiazotropha lotti]MCG7929812.1 copper chaperone PCu(A)C [Candidatus Thiodiazotropha lotti]MCG7940652.1 copper chaperone PCu(A)C [Candidatus Thiodiazotropha lotti]MCG7989569.1 copper chaperone PCu(A)C [Candidatus Thiodiazotropha lotti]MCG8002638.1 copper chaperone PCu(A)C [Candidatus Thiodiazotropha lotti]
MSLQRLLPILGFCLFFMGQQLMAGSAVMADDPYVRAVPPGQPNSASFMTLHNMGKKDLALVSASSSAAEVVELHTHTMEDGMMRMRKVEKIDLPAEQKISLKPGGLHVMLIGLKQKLVPGEKIGLTLSFDDGSELKLDAPVRKLRMKMKQSDHGSHNH